GAVLPGLTPMRGARRTAPGRTGTPRVGADYRASRRISDVRVVVCSPGRNYVTLVVETEDGIIGIGDATLNGRELAVAAYLSEHLAPLLVGRDARRITDTWEYLYRGSYWRRGPVTMAAIAAVDVAW